MALHSFFLVRAAIQQNFGSFKTDINTCSFSEEILKKKNVVQEQYCLCKTEINEFELLGTWSVTVLII